MLTGGGTPVSAATARALAREGHRVVLLGRERGGLARVQEQVRRAGFAVDCVVTDVAVPDQVEWAASWVEDEVGPVDAWVNGELAFTLASSGRPTDEELDRVARCGRLELVNGTAAALRRMRARGWGVVVQVAWAPPRGGASLPTAVEEAAESLQGFAEGLCRELHRERSAVRLGTVTLPDRSDERPDLAAGAVLAAVRLGPRGGDARGSDSEELRRRRSMVLGGLAGVAAATVAARLRDR
ncbi:MAG: SDR family NAD(P)-dependent oxidoreductase [Nocardioidaceae bacterium]